MFAAALYATLALSMASSPGQLAPDQDAPDQAGSLHLAQAEVDTQAKEKVKVMVLAPSSANAEDRNIATAVAGLIPVELGDVRGFEVLSAADVKQMVEFEAEKQAVGCSDNSCLAELAGALGADLVIFGDVSRLGQLIIVNINLFESVQTRAAGRVSIQTKNIEELPTKLGPAMHDLVGPYLQRKGMTLPPTWVNAASPPTASSETEKASTQTSAAEPSTTTSTSTATTAPTSTTTAEGDPTGNAGAGDSDAAAGVFGLLPWAVAGGGAAIGAIGLFAALASAGIGFVGVNVAVSLANQAVVGGDKGMWELMGLVHNGSYLLFYGGITLGVLVVLGGGALATAGIGWGALALAE